MGRYIIGIYCIKKIHALKSCSSFKSFSQGFLYLKGVIGLGLAFRKNQILSVDIYTNSNYEVCLIDCRSNLQDMLIIGRQYNSVDE